MYLSFVLTAVVLGVIVLWVERHMKKVHKPICQEIDAGIQRLQAARTRTSSSHQAARR